MSTNLPTKSSSRAGRFKKKLVSEVALEKEAPVIQERMNQILVAFENQKISAAEFCAIYIIIVLSYRHPGTWLGAKRALALCPVHQLTYPLKSLNLDFEPNIKKRLMGFETLGEVFQFFAFKSTPHTVNRSVINWSMGSYGLEMMFHIPKPSEVLHQQKQGRRCVTIILDQRRASKFILGERDSLGFTMHDLIHADHFYHNNECFLGQLGFYGLLDSCMSQNHFTEHLGNQAFQNEFEYLIADMNAYAVHLMKCLKSALTHYHEDGDHFYQDWLGKLHLQENEKEAFLKLNSVLYEAKDDELILGVFDRYQFSRNLHLP